MARVRALWLAAVAAAALSGCHGDTSVFVTVRFSELELTQLRFSASVDGEPLFAEPRVLPETARALKSPQSVRFLLADELAGRSVEVVAEGLREGTLLAVGRGTVVVARGQDVRLDLSLGESPPDGGLDGGADGGTDAGSDGGADGGPLIAPFVRDAGVCSPDGFCWEHPLPVGNDLLAVTGAGANTVYATGAVGTVIHWDGAGWSGTASNPAADLRGIHAFAVNDVWVVGGTKGLSPIPLAIHWNGSEWSAPPLPISEGLILNAVWGRSPSEVWAVGTGGKILFWNGGSWVAQTSGTGAELLGISGAGGEVFAVGTFRTRCRLQAGPSWTCGSGAGTLNAVAVAAANEAMAVGPAGFVMRWDGTDWVIPASKPTNFDLNGVWAEDPSRYWAVGSGGAIHRWTAGQGFEDLSLPGGPDFEAIWGVGSEAWIVGRRGALARIRNANVELVSPGQSADLYAIAVSIAGGWAVGDGGVTLRGTDAGWVEMPNDTGGKALNGVWAEEAHALAVGENAVMRHWDGLQWNSLSAPVGSSAKSLQAVWGVGPTLVWMAGDVFWRFDGLNVTQEAAVISRLNGLSGSGDTMYGAGPGGKILRIRSDGGTELPGATAVELHAVYAIRSDLAYAVGAFNNVYRVTDQAAPAPGLPFNPFVTHLAVQATSEQDLWVAGSGGNLLHFDGQAWRNVSTGTAFDLHGVSVTPREIRVVGGNGTILRRRR